MHFPWTRVREQEIRLAFTEKDKWLQSVVCGVDEEHDEALSSSRTVRVSVTLSRIKDLEMVNTVWEVNTSLFLLCSRCGQVFVYPCDFAFSDLFCRDEEQESSQPTFHNAFSRKVLDITYLSREYIDLADVLNERLQLQVPLQPLCRGDCAGF